MFLLTFASAQNPLPKNKTQLNFGVGFSSWGVPVYVGFDYGVHKDITIGGELTVRSYKDDWHDKHYKHNIIGISGNANYHLNHVLNIPNNFDFYAGLNLGFYIWSKEDGYGGDHSSGLGLGGQIGGRYFFNKTFGLQLEFGGGNEFSGGKFGLTVKL